MSALNLNPVTVAVGIGLALSTSIGEAQQDGGLEEIIVTARYREENL